MDQVKIQTERTSKRIKIQKAITWPLFVVAFFIFALTVCDVDNDIIPKILHSPAKVVSIGVWLSAFSYGVWLSALTYWDHS